MTKKRKGTETEHGGEKRSQKNKRKTQRVKKTEREAYGTKRANGNIKQKGRAWGPENKKEGAYNSELAWLVVHRGG